MPGTEAAGVASSRSEILPEQRSGDEDHSQQFIEPSYREIERRRKMPSVIRRQIEQVSRMPGIPARDYYELFACFADATEPSSVLEYLWVLDVTVATVEIQFYRRMKRPVIERFRESRADVLADRELAARQPFRHAKGPLPDHFPEAKRKTVRRQLDTPADDAQAFLDSIHSLSLIDDLIDAASRRRDSALRDIERHQKKFAERLRLVSGVVIDGNAAREATSQHEIVTQD